MTTLAIDIGGTKLAAALIDDALHIRERREMPTPASKTPNALVAALTGWRPCGLSSIPLIFNVI